MRVTTLLLAGRRRESDPLLNGSDAPATKAFLQIGGRRMIDRVLETLRASQVVGEVVVSGLAAEDAPADVRTTPTAISPAAAVLAAKDERLPLLVTTCDHALLTPDIVETFVERAFRSDADVSVGFASRTTIEASYPGVSRTYLNFGGEGYSSCNLFLIRTKAGFKAFDFWRAMERDRKKPLTLARRIGPGLLLRYVFRSWVTLENVFAYCSRRIDVKLNPVLLPFADAAVDVDKPSDVDLVERVLAAR